MYWKGGEEKRQERLGVLIYFLRNPGRRSCEGTVTMIHGMQVAAESAIMSLVVWLIKALEFIPKKVHRCVLSSSRIADHAVN